MVNKIVTTVNQIKILRIATRQSPLAMWQAQHVQQSLQARYPHLEIQLVPMTTQGDQRLETPLNLIGGKGLFIKELEQGILNGQADIAVHSLKDVPVEMPPGLHLAAILPREDPQDAWVSSRYSTPAALPPGARVGTSSLRRQCQLQVLYPQWQIMPLRGNVNTRLRKLDAGEFDAIILACAGLKRLGLGQRITQVLTPAQCLPAIGQGVIAIECRTQARDLQDLLAPLHDPLTAACVQAERALNARLQGGCQAPVAGYATLMGAQQLHLRGLVGNIAQNCLLRAEATAPLTEAEALGQKVAEALLVQGAGALLK